MSTNAGHLFGKYRLIGVLASGGMARLYLAVMTGIDGFSRVVALKQVLPHLAESPEFTKMFLNEARLAAKLDHPNIVRIYELGEIDGQYFISMEYLPGEDLTKIVNKSRKKKQWVPVPVAASIVQSVADALQCAHDLVDETGKPLGLVHRDVSLSNVIVSYHGLPKLADFGIAKATAVPSVATRAGTFKGKFAYSAPEQVTAKEVDSRTDVFALGIVLWELLTIRRLFKRESDAATIRAVEEAEVPAVSSIRSDVPKEIDRIALKALAKRPKDRFQSAAEMSDALEEVLSKIGSQSSTKLLSKWLSNLFGEETASTKKAVAQGRFDLAGDPDLPLPTQQAALIGLTPVPVKRRPTVPALAAAAAASEASLPRSVRPPLPPPGGSDSSNPGNSSRIAGRNSTTPSREQSSLRPSERPRSMSGPRAAWSTEHSLEFPARTPSVSQRALTFDSGSMPLFSTGSSSSSVVEDPPIPERKNHSRLLVVIGSLIVLMLGLAVIVSELTRGDGTENPAQAAQVGVVRFDRVPSGSTLFVDDRRVSANEAIELTVGEHQVRVEKDGKVIDQRAFEVRPGDQSVELGR